MIEVVHFRNRYGKQMVGVFNDVGAIPTAKSYADRYAAGLEKPYYPLPAIPLQVVWPDPDNHIGYKDMIYIDDVSDPDDPVMVCAWDFYDGPNHIGQHGEYTRTT